MAGSWGGISRELQRLLSLIGYGSTGGVCGRSLTAGKILFTGRQTCSLYLVLWLCGKGLHEYYNIETKKLIFFSKKFEIEFDSHFDLCWRTEINIQVGLNMHLYVDIGDASSSLWGSTSSLKFRLNLTQRVTGSLVYL